MSKNKNQVNLVLMGKKVLLKLLWTYKRFLSPLLPPSCRYNPSCSMYMYEAVAKHGCICGIWLGIKRLLRCHPFYPHYRELDPVP